MDRYLNLHRGAGVGSADGDAGKGGQRKIFEYLSKKMLDEKSNDANFEQRCKLSALLAVGPV